MEPTSRLSLKYLLDAVSAHWFTAIAIALLCFAGVVGYVTSLQPRFTSTAVVLLSPASDGLADQTRTSREPMTDPFFIRSETVIISSDELCLKVIEKLQLWNDPEFALSSTDRSDGVLPRDNASQQDSPLTDREKTLDYTLRRYRNDLSVFNDGRNKTVEISFTASGPRLAAKIADAHAEAYLQEQSVRRAGAQQKAIEWLSKEVDARAEEVREADARVQQYQLNSGIVSTQDTTIVEQRLGQISTQLIEARRQLAKQQAVLSELRQIRFGADASNAASMTSDQAFANLLQSRVAKEAEIDSAGRRFVAGHPTLVKLRQELAGINVVLDGQLQRLESEAASNTNWWQRQVTDLEAAVAKETDAKMHQDRAAAGLPSLLAQAQVKHAVFETVLSRYQTLLAEHGFTGAAALIVSRALPSAQPSYPKPRLLLVIGGMISMLIGAAFAVALHIYKSKSAGLISVADSIGVRPLVAIPRFKSSRVSGTTRIADPQLFIESIRYLRDAVLPHRQSQPTTTYLITSVLPRQGKSLVAMSLARAIARTGRRTLLMEVDLRQPTASLLARLAYPADGTVAVLEGRVPLESAVVRDEATGLDMLLAEQQASTALDRLTTSMMRDLLAEIGTQYDAIVMDSPPVGVVSDALTLAPLADQTILVAKDGDSSESELKKGVRMLREAGATVAGLVLTSVDPQDVSSLDRKTLSRYVVGFPAPIASRTVMQSKRSESLTDDLTWQAPRAKQ